MEKRLLELHRQWEQKKKKMLDEEVRILWYITGAHITCAYHTVYHVYTGQSRGVN